MKIKTTIVSGFFLVGLIFTFATNPIYAQISPVPDTAHVQLLTGGIIFAEGPLWHPDEFLLCTDLNGNRIFKIDPQTGAKQIYLSPSGGANGLAFDLQQNLVMCRRDARDLARLESNGDITILVSGYNELRFNSPNDLTVRSDGTIFFTDPFFLSSPTPQELDFDGVYALKPDGALILLDSTVTGPNGICLSPNEQKLYVSAAQSRTIYVYDIENDTTLTNKSVFAQIPSANYLDGMKVDVNGLLFTAAGNKGVWIFSPGGVWIDTINVPGNVTNLNWGDPDYQTLYITNMNNVYKIRLNTTGVVVEVEHKDVTLPKHYELLQNYPNPFNPATTIRYSLLKPSQVELKIYNALGQLVTTLVNEHQTTGEYSAVWDGKDANGNLQASGIYFYRIQMGEFRAVRKMTYLR